MDYNNEEEILRRKYRDLARKLSQIKNELNTVNSMNSEIIDLANSTLRINKKVVENNSLNNLKSSNQKLISGISNTISQCNRF